MDSIIDILHTSLQAPFSGAFIAIVAIPILVVTTCLIVVSSHRRRADAARQTDARLGELIRSQAEMQGRLSQMTDTLARRQSELGQSVNQRLDGMTNRLGNSINEQTKSTHENLRLLQERLAVIDVAQNNIQNLAKDVVGLQAILTNKQTRGAFGQGRMEAIISDGLPMGAYTFQASLSNGKRPDCTIKMPNGAPALVIDAKFPLEAWNRFREASTPDVRKTAGQQFRRDLEVHIRDIAEKYFIVGETQDMAFLFVPSESIFAEIHEHFEIVVQKAQRSRVVIVSPSLLMLSIQVIEAVLKDQRMREQAHLIQHEVTALMDDLARLDDRTRKLQSHFLSAQRDVEQILISSDKLTRRGTKIGGFELEDVSTADTSAEQNVSNAVESRTGMLKLRMVDDD